MLENGVDYNRIYETSKKLDTLIIKYYTLKYGKHSDER